MCLCLLLWSKFCRFFNRFFSTLFIKLFALHFDTCCNCRMNRSVFGIFFVFFMLLRTEGDRERGRGSETESVRSGDWANISYLAFYFILFLASANDTNKIFHSHVENAAVRVAFFVVFCKFPICCCCCSCSTSCCCCCGCLSLASFCPLHLQRLFLERQRKTQRGVFCYYLYLFF